MMEWNVFRFDFNSKEVVPYNILSHSRFVEYAKEKFAESATKEEFAEKLHRPARYYFWSKCECEFIISSWPPREGTERKVDMYEQLLLNWKHFSNYLWSLLENNSL